MVTYWPPTARAFSLTHFAPLVRRIATCTLSLKASEEGLFVKAVENARKKADQMAAAVGAKTGRALKITTTQEYGSGSSRAMETYSTGGGVSEMTEKIDSKWNLR